MLGDEQIWIRRKNSKCFENDLSEILVFVILSIVIEVKFVQYILVRKCQLMFDKTNKFDKC